jgi:pyridoxine 5-phosphate synthase
LPPTTGAEQQAEIERIKNMATYAHSIGLQVNAGHGLTLENTRAIAQLPEIVELNMGHSRGFKLCTNICHS